MIIGLLYTINDQIKININNDLKNKINFEFNTFYQILNIKDILKYEKQLFDYHIFFMEQITDNENKKLLKWKDIIYYANNNIDKKLLPRTLKIFSLLEKTLIINNRRSIIQEQIINSLYKPLLPFINTKIRKTNEWILF